ncbi:hypothetical protein ACFL6U_08665 [Planctomycetota bacterium]
MAQKCRLSSTLIFLRCLIVLLATSTLVTVSAENIDDQAQAMPYYRGYERDAQRVVSHLETTCDDEDKTGVKTLRETLTQYSAALEAVDQAKQSGETTRFDQVEELKLKHSALVARILRCPPIAFIERATRSETGTNGTVFSRDMGSGATVWYWDPQTQQEPRKILHTEEGIVWDLEPSYDGKRLLMSYREKRHLPFRIYEINIDGTGLRPITDGTYHDFNPAYYPDGRIVFSSSRVEAFSMCQDYLACALYMCQLDGSDIRRIDWTTICSNEPSVLPDGRIMVTRWEYQDKLLTTWQALWTLMPNGSNMRLYYGNTMLVPNTLYGGKCIPETNQVLFTMAAHHHPAYGDIVIVDRRKGIENPDAMRQITNLTKFQITAPAHWRDLKAAGPGDRNYPWSYTDPWPVTKDYSLVASGQWKHFRLKYLWHEGLDIEMFGRWGKSYYSPVSLNPRPKGLAIPGDAPQEAGLGTFYVHDVYQGLLEKGVRRNEITHLRIMEVIPKSQNGEGNYIYNQYPLSSRGTYYIKRNHGTVPVGEDGSAYFRAPSNCELYFIALDKDGKEIQRMGSVTQITTGETVSCLGCHDHRDRSPILTASRPRLQRQPDTIAPPPWGAGNMDYVKHVQPVFNRYCVECHSGAKPEGGLDLSDDKNRYFNMSYAHLMDKKLVEYYWLIEGPTGIFPAKASGSYVSKLTKILEEKHEDVDVDDISRRAIYAWIDADVPYYSTYYVTRPHTRAGRDTWGQPAGKQEFIYLPWVERVLDVATRRGLTTGLGGESDFAHMADKRYFKEINMTNPQWSRLLLDNLAESAGGCATDESAPFKDTQDPDYRVLLAAITEGKKILYETPRADMPGAVFIPQERNFGKVFPPGGGFLAK